MKHTINILIIEDEAIIAADIQSMLEELGYNTLRIINRSEEAIDYLSFHTPDLVLCDINIKGDLDGIEVSNRIRKKKKIPFIYLTSLSDSETIKRASKSFPYGYIIKPFDESDLHSAIEVALMKFQQELDSLTIDKDKLDQIAISPLTHREFEIIQAILKGISFQAIQEKFDISKNTMKFHSKNIYAKFELANKTELMQNLLSHFTRIT